MTVVANRNEINGCSVIADTRGGGRVIAYLNGTSREFPATLRFMLPEPHGFVQVILERAELVAWAARIVEEDAK